MNDQKDHSHNKGIYLYRGHKKAHKCHLIFGLSNLRAIEHVFKLQEIRGVGNVIERAAQEDMQKKLTDMKQAQDDLRQEQQDLKKHTLNRLDTLDEKMEWFLSKGQQGAHPLSDRMSQIEGKLEVLNTTLMLIKDFLLVRTY